MSTKIENPLVTIRFIYYLKVKLSIFFTLKIIYERERIRARAGWGIRKTRLFEFKYQFI